MQIVLLRDGTAHDDAKGIVESVHANPVHTKFLLIVRGQLREHLLAVLRVLLEHHIPARPRILGINVECAALHPRLDVRCAAADARRNARLQSRILLNDHLQHLTHDKLLRHGLRRDVNDIRSAEKSIRHTACSDENSCRRSHIGNTPSSRHPRGMFQPCLRTPQDSIC